MNFFKSILSDDPIPNSTPELQHSDPQMTQLDPSSSNPSSASAATASGDGAWSFSGLVKTLATQSESVIEIYRRDLNEFKSGLQKETATFRDIASRAVKDLPAEIDGVLKSTADIISHGTDSLLAPLPTDRDSSTDDLWKYSRFEAQLRVIESDMNTYCEELEDSEDFSKWKLGFVLGEKKEENETIEGIYKKVVPNVVDDETFWYRYYYRVHKLKRQEDARANLVKRAISIDMDEELSWDVDDEDEEDSFEIKETQKDGKFGETKVDEKGEMIIKPKLAQTDEISKLVDEKEIDQAESSKIDETTKLVDEKREIDKPDSSKIFETTKLVNEREIDKPELSKIDGTFKVADEKAEINKPELNEVEETTKVLDDTEVINKPKSTSDKIVEVGTGETTKDSGEAIVSTQLPEEEDMGWDEIEDVGSGDEKKEVVKSGTPNRDDLRKRLSIAEEEDEDLSWDIEEEDGEPVAKFDAK